MQGHLHGQLPEILSLKPMRDSPSLRNIHFTELFYFPFFSANFILFNLSLCSLHSSFTLTIPSPENLSKEKDKYNTALSDKTAMETCPGKMGAISVPEIIQQLQTAAFLRCDMSRNTILKRNVENIN